ncbi:NADH-quinone oxidoreductase subunit J family protein [Nonomuraea sp. SYSU D8015]|uniref:NADH-quinone oxidoreductase subunit J family protein n=1 Tax=Nonomuraea sp. SYSU D8015 TaxID=2593644 RepID=UPI001CB6C690|nr:NADH-quinone oxidoreductase subunit J [Nonomuraea sp. SYSU D8015]
MTEAVPSYLSPTGQEIVFLLLGAVAVGSALLVVTTKQLVHAALWLVVCFGALAGCYLVLTAEFVAWVQVLIYVGAVVVLLLFGIMLTRAPIGRSADLDSGNRLVSALVALATAAILVTVVIDGFRAAYTPLKPGPGAAKELGASVFATWVLPFEALSVLLLAALIGAIVLSRTDIPGGSPADQPADSPPPDQTRAPSAPDHTRDSLPSEQARDSLASHQARDSLPAEQSQESPASEQTVDKPAPHQTGGTSAPDQTGGH